MNRILVFFAVVFLVSFQVGGQPTLDLSGDWRFMPDPENVGVDKGWFAPDFSDEQWKILQGGTRWEEQGFTDLDGYAWYRKWISVPSEWTGKQIWLVLGAVNDNYVLYCNGRKVNTFGDETDRSIAEIATAADLTSFVKCGERNMIAIRVFDWGGNGGLWRKPVLLTTDPGELAALKLWNCLVIYDERKIEVESSLHYLGNELPEGTIRFDLYGQDGSQPVSSKEVGFRVGEQCEKAVFDLAKAKSGERYQLKGTFLDQKGTSLVTTTVDVEWPQAPSWPDRYGKLKILNNFVTELSSRVLPDQGNVECSFSNPREGWVFFSISSGENEKQPPILHLNDSAEPLVMRSEPETNALEAMQFLPEGAHRLLVKNIKRQRLVIRAVPEMIYGYHPSGPHITAYGTYDWSYLERYVLSNANTIVTGGVSDQPEFDQWVREGRKWLCNSSLPGLGAPTAPTADDVYAVWAQNAGVAQPHFGGMIVDEFLSAGESYYKSWTEALRRVHANESFKGKRFYAYCGNIFQNPGDPSIPFGQAILEYGDRFALEAYLQEQPTESAARNYLLKQLQQEHKIASKVIPRWGEHLVMCLGYLSAPPETLNINPAVDYKVFMDMQFYLLATDPTFWRLFGIYEYMSSYADEEDIRWASQLFRHYCIEGKRTRYSRDPYALDHIVNPDFEEGKDGWTVEPAEDNAIGMEFFREFSYLEGRYPKTPKGDRLLRMRRSVTRPNRISQDVKNLESGRLYSLKFFSADLKNLHQKQEMTVSVDLGDVQLIDKYCFQQVFPSCYSHEVGEYTKDNPAYINFHRIVFRPKQATTKLTISDWKTSDNRGGDVGQETSVNFIEIQPFLEPR
ncbi:MAG TPA: hypothetical protein PLY86_00550 [bacterium]|nr:hypothetical protein [bacterium]